LGLPKTGQSLPLLTSVAEPISGTVLRGKVFLVATASGNYPIKGVDFRISDPTTGPVIVLPGAHFVYGWLGIWVSTVLPNGNYTIQSIAHDTAGHVKVSPATPVTLKN
jgi:hypothetical protein